VDVSKNKCPFQCWQNHESIFPDVGFS